MARVAHRASVVVAGLALLLAGCTGTETNGGQDFGVTPPPDTDTPEPPKVQIERITVRDDAFVPKTVEIKVGTAVEWVWGGRDDGKTQHRHNVVADSGGFRSGEPTQGEGPFPWSFSAAGTFAYHCEVHGAEQGIGMSGTVVVTQ